MSAVAPVLGPLERAAPFQRQVALSAAVVVATVLLARLAVPYAVRGTERFVDERLLVGRAGTALRRVEAELPGRAPGAYLVAVYRAALVVAGLMALAVVWELNRYVGTGLVGLYDLLAANWDVIRRIPVTAVMLVFAFVAMGLLDDVVERVRMRSDRLDKHQSEVVYRVLQVTLLTTIGLVILDYWQVNLGGLLIGAGFLGIVVGMAARQTLGAALAGFVLMFSKPFQVGDWIQVDEYEGVVTDITIVNTRLENFDGEYVVLPNDMVGNSTVVNRTRKGRLRVRLGVGVDYSVDPGHAEEAALAALDDVDEVMSVPRPEVVPTGFGDSAIHLELRFWIDNPSSRRRWRARAAVVRAVYRAFEREGIKIPFPQRELSGRAEAGGLRVGAGRDSRGGPESGPEAGPDGDGESAELPGDAELPGG